MSKNVGHDIYVLKREVRSLKKRVAKLEEINRQKDKELREYAALIAGD